jgi:hypothetical protein
MDASTTEEMATTIHRHNGHKGHNNHKSVRGNRHNHGDNNGYDHNKDNHFVKKDISQVVCYKCNSKGQYATTEG